MAKSANPGSMRTAVYFKRIERQIDSEGIPIETELNIFGKDVNGDDVPAYGLWTNVHGSEVIAAMQLQLHDPATFTTRYSPKYDPQLIVYKAGDPKPYEIISLDNVGEHNRWVEINLQRRVAAR